MSVCTGLSSSSRSEPLPRRPALAVKLPRAASGHADLESCLIVNTVTANVPFRSLIDTGAACNLVSPDLARRLALRLTPLQTPHPILLADGSTTTSNVTHHAQIRFKIPEVGRSWTASVLICPLGELDMILGMPWVKPNAHLIDWSTPTLVVNHPSVPTPHVAPPRSMNASPAAIHIAARHAIISEGLVPVDAFPSVDDPPDYMEYLRSTVPSQYHDLLAAFSKTTADTLPRDRGALNHSINVLPNCRPPAERVRPTSTVKLASQKEWLDDMLRKGFIRRSKSPYGANLTSTPKSDGTPRWCIDFRRLNTMTVKDKTPLPLISESLVLLGKARRLTRFDLRSAFNQVLMDADSIEKTAFVTREGLFECLVMPFGLTNAGATFQRLVNIALHGLIDVICVVYLDDIIVFSTDPSQHNDHVRQVLERLIQHGLYIKAEKCEFSATSTKFLGHTVSPEGICMDLGQVSAVTSYPPPTNPKQLSRFIGLANSYRRYIKDFASLARPLNLLLRKSTVPTTPFLSGHFWLLSCLTHNLPISAYRGYGSRRRSSSQSTSEISGSFHIIKLDLMRPTASSFHTHPQQPIYSFPFFHNKTSVPKHVSGRK